MPRFSVFEAHLRRLLKSSFGDKIFFIEYGLGGTNGLPDSFIVGEGGKVTFLELKALKKAPPTLRNLPFITPEQPYDLPSLSPAHTEALFDDVFRHLRENQAKVAHRLFGSGSTFIILFLLPDEQFMGLLLNGQNEAYIGNLEVRFLGVFSQWGCMAKTLREETNAKEG